MTRTVLARVLRPNSAIASASVRSREPTTQRQLIVATARELVAQSQNADAVSMRVLGRSLGVSAAAIYRYYPDRDSVLCAVCESVLAELGDVLAQASAHDVPERALHDLGLAYTAFVSTHIEEMTLVRRFRDDNHAAGLGGDGSIDVDPLMTSLARVVGRCERAGLLGSYADVRVVTDSLNAALTGLTSKRYLCAGRGDPSIETLWRHTVDRHLGTDERRD